MSGQSKMTDMRNIHQATFHHVPAHETLQPPEYKCDPKLRFPPFLNPSKHQKDHKWNKVNESDYSPEQPVPEFPVKNAFELFKIHVPINFLELGILLIGLKSLLPFNKCKRRNHAHDWSPIDHGQTTLSKSGNTANNNHEVDHRTDTG